MSMESDLMFLIFQIEYLLSEAGEEDKEVVMPKLASLLIRTISLFNSMDMDSQPKPESEFISLIKQIISLSRSITNSEPDWELISQMTSFILLVNSDLKQGPQPELIPLLTEIVSSEWDSDSKLILLIKQIFEVATAGGMRSLISLSPVFDVQIREDKFQLLGKVQRESGEKKNCDPNNLKMFSLTGDVPTHFHCIDCNGEYHEECDKAPVEVKHPLHPKHSLQLVTSRFCNSTSECFCCDEDLEELFYYCSACEYAMNIACVEKPRVLSIDYPKWHEHTLVLFSRHTTLTCDVCALTHSRSPFYICPPCGFVVHQKCTNLPRVIKISRHLHRIFFTTSFDQANRFCGVCQRKVDRDYGGYSCIKKGCSYVAHSRCATQSNVWDGVDLDGVPEEIEEEVLEPFVTISDGIIQHFIHQQHHLGLDKNGDRNYDDMKQCQACVTPIYCGNIYSCTQCDFILHEKCANLSRKLFHPIHPHMLTLVGGYGGVINCDKDRCSACGLVCTGGFFYECGEEGCGPFKLHVQCATISEPLVHESHMHPLFLTSKPGEERRCEVCIRNWMETFNCIEECDFSLCFNCATLPHKVRYKHDKHMLTLTYGEETSTMEYWCESCEGKIEPRKRFYRCDDDCCVTLHIECLIGKHLYIKPNSLFIYGGKEFDVLANSHHMSRPICSYCKKRCPYSIVFQNSGSITCCIVCTLGYLMSPRL